jgi:hypothetical protein
MFLLKVVRAFQSARVEFALCGGQAVALHGALRGTVDVDFVVKLGPANLERAEKVLTKDLALVSRIPIRSAEMAKFRLEYIKKRNLKAWSFVDPTRLSDVVDLVITNDLAELSVVHKEAWGQKIPVVSIGDLIAMKRESGRPQDLADVEALEMIMREAKRKRK